MLNPAPPAPLHDPAPPFYSPSFIQSTKPCLEGPTSGPFLHRDPWGSSVRSPLLPVATRGVPSPGPPCLSPSPLSVSPPPSAVLPVRSRSTIFWPTGRKICDEDPQNIPPTDDVKPPPRHAQASREHHGLSLPSSAQFPHPPLREKSSPLHSLSAPEFPPGERTETPIATEIFFFFVAAVTVYVFNVTTCVTIFFLTLFCSLFFNVELARPDLDISLPRSESPQERRCPSGFRNFPLLNTSDALRGRFREAVASASPTPTPCASVA